MNLSGEKEIRGLGRLEMTIQAGKAGWIPSPDLLGLVCVHCIHTYTLGHTDILIKINRVKVAGGSVFKNTC